MNEEELKDLWRHAGRNAPAIDLKPVEQASDDWRRRLRRKAGIDIAIQISSAVAGVLACIFYPRLILFNLMMIPICIWYVRKLRELYRADTGRADLPVRELLELKVDTFEKFFRQTRFVVYAVNPLAVHAFLYGFGLYEKVSNSPGHPWTLIRAILLMTFFYEVAAVIANEIYFKLVYKPAYRQLRDLCDQLRYAG